MRQIEGFYCSALGGLNAWRKKSYDAVEKQHSDLKIECSSRQKSLAIDADEMERTRQSYQEFLSSADVAFLQVGCLCQVYVSTMSMSQPCACLSLAYVQIMFMSQPCVRLNHVYVSTMYMS